MEHVLPMWLECKTAGEVIPLAAWFGTDSSPVDCLGGRQMALCMPGWCMVQGMPGILHSEILHWRSMVQGIAGMGLAGSLHLWSTVQGTAGMHHPDTLHMGSAALSECT